MTKRYMQIVLLGISISIAANVWFLSRAFARWELRFCASPAAQAIEIHDTPPVSLTEEGGSVVYKLKLGESAEIVRASVNGDNPYFEVITPSARTGYIRNTNARIDWCPKPVGIVAWLAWQ